jgi:RNA polymerase sigma factor (sigma-70 family)
MAREAVLALPQAERSRMTLLDPHPRPLDDPAECTDAELMAAVRGGDRAVYAELYARHQPAARRMARQLSPSPHDVDDLVAEAFARVFDMLNGGRGPDSSFRAYLLTAVRNGMYERARRDRRLELSEDMGRHDRGVPWVDTVEAELDSALAARAFASLPERWRTVLWYSEVEQQSTAEVGSRLGLRPNAVAALAYRAREGLRQAFLQAHVTSCADDACRYAVTRLGSWTRDRLSSGDTARVDAHLASCRRCRLVAAELAEVNSELGGLLAPVLLGAAASGWLASLVRDSAGAGSEGVASAGAAGTAASAGAASGGAASAGAGAAAAVSSGAAGSVAGGSVLGWLAGTQAGPAMAVLTAVVVGGTAVVAGVAVPQIVHRSPAAGASTPGVVDADELAPGTSADAASIAKTHQGASARKAETPKKAGAKSAKAAPNAPTRGSDSLGSANGQSDAARNAQGNGQTVARAAAPGDSQSSPPTNGQSNPPHSAAPAGEPGSGQTSPPKAAQTAQDGAQAAQTTQGGTRAAQTAAKTAEAAAATTAAEPAAAPVANAAGAGPASVSTTKPARSIRVSSGATGSPSRATAAPGQARPDAAAHGGQR